MGSLGQLTIGPILSIISYILRFCSDLQHLALFTYQKIFMIGSFQAVGQYNHQFLRQILGSSVT